MRVLLIAMFLAAAACTETAEAGCPDDLYCQHESQADICQDAITDWMESPAPYGMDTGALDEQDEIETFCSEWIRQRYGTDLP